MAIQQGTATGLARIGIQTGLHGFLGGMLSGASGNGFGNGFLAGAFGNLASTGAQGIFEHAGNVVNAAGTFASGAVIGGLGAEIGGGNFWDGFRNGAITAGLNHVAHSIEKTIELNAFAKKMFGDDFKEVYGVKSLKWGSQMGNSVEGAYYNSKDMKIYVDDNGPTAGLTTIDRRIYIADGIKYYGADFLTETIGHELIHSYQRMTFGYHYMSSYSEYAAYQYSIDFSIEHNFAPRQINFFRLQQSTYPKPPAAYNYRRIPGF